MRFSVWPLGLILCLGAAPAPVDDNARCAPSIEIPLSGEACDPLRPPTIACEPWSDVQGHLEQPDRNTVQRAADLFSWQVFLALNWPLGDARGEPSRSEPFSHPGPRVWESWKEAFEIYLPDGSRPAPWNAAEPIPAACRVAAGSPSAPATKLLLRDAKVDDVVDEIVQALPADGTLPASLKDQQGRLVRYEIRLNRPLFDYIADPESGLYNGLALYNGEEQAKAASVDFPVGSQLIKAAWRQVEDDEAPFFHTTRACVCDQVGVDTPTACRLETMGLAGFHVMTKTESAPQWIWSTFEQIDNVVSTHGTVHSLNDPSCPPELCPPNRQTEGSLPTQVRRTIPIPSADPDCSRPELAVDNVARLNQDVQAKLAERGSPFRFYQLVGTQWPEPGGPDEAHDTVFAALPALLANSTMETFAQNTSSCMGCHAMSRTLSPSRFVSADFSFTLNNAQPRPRGALCVEAEASVSCSDSILPPPVEPQTEWDREHWSEVTFGFAAATRTYELTNPRYVRSRLHCASCHLDAGGNRDAAWWVDMPKVYDYPATTELQERINGCFERSMNGRAICSTDDGPPASSQASPQNCAESPIMRGLITYMQWLTEQYYERHPDGKPCRGYPPFQVTVGDAQRGRQIYVQKCSFCHNAEGQGRYPSHTYFRPALWGPDSFNACAGMARTTDLGAFLRWNMPYTSGGMLDSREANDLAAYIDGQCRPGKGGVGPDGEPCSLTPSCIDGVQPPTGSLPEMLVSSYSLEEDICPEFAAMAAPP